MKTALYLTLALLMCGCIASTVYVCPDGSKADDPSLCRTKASLEEHAIAENVTDCMGFRTQEGKPDDALINRCLVRNNPTTGFCDANPGLERTRCLIEAASYSNSTAPCKGLDGNMRLICEAAAQKDALVCERIGVEELRQECMGTLAALTPHISEKANCTGKADDELAWCLIYNAEDADECLKIDDRRYHDAAVFCAAKAAGDAERCSGIVDGVMRNLCRKAVLGL